MFRSWFNRGFLTLARIDWQTSAVVLERLIPYEAVHQIAGGQPAASPGIGSPLLCVLPSGASAGAVDLHRGCVDPGRDVSGAAAARSRLARRRPGPRHLCHLLFDHELPAGPEGVPFGNVLIKQVVDDLGKEFPTVRTFATLSPIPGSARGSRNGRPPALNRSHRRWRGGPKGDDIAAADIGRCARRTSRGNDATVRALSDLHGRWPGRTGSVARFHLANGARLSDSTGWATLQPPTASPTAWSTTQYRLADLERNHDAYANQFRVASSTAFRKLTKPVAQRTRRSIVCAGPACDLLDRRPRLVGVENGDRRR